MTETIHGFPIIASANTSQVRDGAQGRIILVDRGEDGFVTALHFVGDAEWNHGHYFDDRAEARNDFYVRSNGGNPWIHAPKVSQGRAEPPKVPPKVPKVRARK